MFSIIRATTVRATLQTRSFAVSAPSADLARLTLIGRLGKDPQVKTNVSGKEYIVYTVATKNVPGPVQEDGSRRDGGTSWHSVLSFAPGANEYLKTLQKGTQVFVEARYELKEADPTAQPDSPSSRRKYPDSVSSVRGSRFQKRRDD